MKKTIKSKTLALILSALMLFSLLPTAIAADADAVYTDVAGHWAADAITKWSTAKYGILQGNGNGTFAPDNPIKANDLTLVVDRIFGIAEPEWANSAVLSREAAARVIALALNLTPATAPYGALFADDALIGASYKPYVYALKDLGYVQGMGENVFEPQGSFTRAQVLTVVQNAISEITDGNLTGQTYANDLVIRKSGAVITDVSVKRDLIVGQGVGDGDVTLDSVTVAGTLFVLGGGSNSIIIKGESDIAKIVSLKVEGEPVRIKIEGEAVVDSIEVGEDSSAIINGNVALVTADEGSALTIQAGTVAALDIVGDGAEIKVEKGAAVTTATIEAADVTIEGEGKVAAITVTEDAGAGNVVKVDGAKIVNESDETVATGSKGADVPANSTGTGAADASTGGTGTGGGGGSAGPAAFALTSAALVTDPWDTLTDSDDNVKPSVVNVANSGNDINVTVPVTANLKSLASTDGTLGTTAKYVGVLVTTNRTRDSLSFVVTPKNGSASSSYDKTAQGDPVQTPWITLNAYQFIFFFPFADDYYETYTITDQYEQELIIKLSGKLDYTVKAGDTYTVDNAETLTIPAGKTLTVKGTLNVAGTLNVVGSIV
ncbi:MAG: S-layer homology domain-containing protein, partial [Oscillospiraceae bacterium]|nr:S-layer homology domain-containing protein [Oscillospiraceae bacterium]